MINMFAFVDSIDILTNLLVSISSWILNTNNYQKVRFFVLEIFLNEQNRQYKEGKNEK